MIRFDSVLVLLPHSTLNPHLNDSMTDVLILLNVLPTSTHLYRAGNLSRHLALPFHNGSQICSRNSFRSEQFQVL